MSAINRLVCAVMAGGSGTRFWPLSRRARPKQLLSLLEQRSLLRATVDRIAPVCPPSRTLVITAQRLADATAAELAELSTSHIIAEPAARNTAPCMAIAAIAAHQIDPNAIVALLPADHHVGDAQAFRDALAVAAEQAEAGYLTTLGVVPTRPETGFGYIEVGQSVGGASEVVGFVEKPDLETASKYLISGKYLWNGGIFVARADVALKAIAQHLPEVDAALAPLSSGECGRFGSQTFNATLNERFGQCPSISIDYGIAEHMTDMRTVPLAAGWSDVGTWASLVQQGHGTDGNFIRGDVLNLDNDDCVIVSDGPLVAALGLRGIAVIATNNAVLAMPLERSQDVRKVVDALKQAGHEDKR